MTISITIMNNDSREDSIIRVSEFNYPFNGVYSSRKDLKGGESTDLYLYENHKVIIEELPVAGEPVRYEPEKVAETKV